MSIKSFFIGLLVVFIIYEVFAITLGVIKKKKQQKEIMKESEDNQDVSSKD